jgi:hypothetical protein
MEAVTFYKTRRKTSVPRKAIRDAVRAVFGPLKEAEAIKTKNKKTNRAAVMAS